jgi:nitroreductase
MNTLEELLSPAQLIERLEWRYATKQFDPDRKIPADVWSALEDALLLSPSSAGLQPWAFYIVTDPAVREQLLPASYGQAQVREASHLVVFAAKNNFGVADVEAHIARTAEVRGVSVESLKPFRDMIVGGIVNAKDDAARLAWAGRQATIALGTLLTSAAMLGVDACPMEGFVPAQYDAILGLDQKGLTSIAICALGYRSSTDKYADLPKVRFPKDQVIHRVGAAG